MTRKLLLADDSVTVQRVIELTFRDEGMQVVAVSDGRQAIDRVVEERPDIVLADVTMPERDGYEVAAYIKAAPELAHIPVVLMTGAFEQIDEARARDVGCDGVLAKPFEPHMAIALVRQLLAGERPGIAPAADAASAPAPAGVAADYPFDAPPSATTLDDYFDKLDEALSHAAAGNAEPTPRFDLPSTVADEGEALAAYDAGQGLPDRLEASPVATDVAGVASPPSDMADVFSALLAEELGEAAPDAVPFTLANVARPTRPDVTPPSPPAPVITDALIDEIVRRVTDRLTDHAVRETIASQALAVAERLVREEIDRLKTQA